MDSNEKINVKKPGSLREKRKLKEGLVEDDNEDIAYLNFRLIWPIGIFSFGCLFFFGLSIGTMEVMNHLDNLSDEQLKTSGQLWAYYGRMYLQCNNTIPYEDGMYPSILRQVEMKVVMNVLYRVAVCVPMAMRIFLTLVAKNTYFSDYQEINSGPRYGVFYFFNELCSLLSIVEILSLALFSILTIRFDYPTVYKYSFSLFVISSVISMYLRTILSFVLLENESKIADKLSTISRLICAIIFAWTSSRFIYTHVDFVNHMICHGYVEKWTAINEYLFIAAYLVFNLSLLIDIRDIRFIVYPRTCSGECEPLVPKNFEQDEKYEHCRSYELRQRQLKKTDVTKF